MSESEEVAKCPIRNLNSEVKKLAEFVNNVETIDKLREKGKPKAITHLIYFMQTMIAREMLTLRS